MNEMSTELYAFTKTKAARHHTPAKKRIRHSFVRLASPVEKVGQKFDVKFITFLKLNLVLE